MRRVHETIVAVKSNTYYIFWMCVCNLSYPASKKTWAVLHYHLWPAWLCHILPHYLINGTIFEKKKKSLNKNVFWFSLRFLSQTFLILGKITRHTVISVHMSSCKAPVILVRFNETWVFGADFRKMIKTPHFIKIRPVGAQFFESGRKNGHTNMTTLTVAFSQFC